MHEETKKQTKNFIIWAGVIGGLIALTGTVIALTKQGAIANVLAKIRGK
jgi:hypothetical protein